MSIAIVDYLVNGLSPTVEHVVVKVALRRGREEGSLIFILSVCVCVWILLPSDQQALQSCLIQSKGAEGTRLRQKKTPVQNGNLVAISQVVP